MKLGQALRYYLENADSNTETTHQLRITDSAYTNDVNLFCAMCKQSWRVDALHMPLSSQSIASVLATVGTCIGSMYKPIPNTPWFTYGKVAQYPAP